MVSSHSSRPPSRTSSLSSSVLSRASTEFTVPTSHAPSECGSSFDYGTACNDMGSDLSQPKRRSQLVLAAVAARPPDASVSRVHHSSEPLRTSSVTPGPSVQDQVLTAVTPSLHLAGVHRTRSFRQLPSSLPPAHTITMSYAYSDTGSGANLGDRDPSRVGSPAIDELSPDEDERFAESIIRDKRKCLCLSASTCSLSALNPRHS